MRNVLFILLALCIGIIASCHRADPYAKHFTIVEANDSLKVLQMPSNKAVVFRSDFLITDSTHYRTPRTFSFAERYLPDGATPFDPDVHHIIEFEDVLDDHIQNLQAKAETLSWEDTTATARLILHNSQAARMETEHLLKQYWGYINPEKDSVLSATFTRLNPENRNSFT